MKERAGSGQLLCIYVHVHVCVSELVYTILVSLESI